MRTTPAFLRGSGPWISLASATLLAVACASAAGEPGPVFKEVSVHDPSILKAGDDYYVFGSHLGAAKSKDLLAWDLIGAGANERNPLFADVREELKETFEWAQSRTLWAPDVVRLKDGRFAMYYCACKGDSPRSALGLATADKPEGPYKNQGILLKSGMWGQPSEDGKVYDARVHPNAVDPSVFYDPEGRLWMVYGSYSGGIFILKMNPATGRPLPGQGYGRRLTGGNHARIEGAYILRHPKSKFYYLFISFGGLDSRGGYNIRVARSKNPDGPYLDAAGKPMDAAMADPSKPLFDDRSIEPFGTKLMGGFQFSGEFKSYGYLSPGHNSAIHDPKTGRFFLVFHTRFPGRGEGHQVRVHELVMAKGDWLVAAPFRYGGEEQGPISAKSVPGSYQVVSHGSAITAEPAQSQAIVLTDDGSVTGALTGRWKAGSQNRITLRLQDGVYEGVLMNQWQAETGKRTITFSALSDKGLAIWGIKGK